MRRFKETRTVEKPGLGGGTTTESRVVEVAKDEQPPKGATETNEPVRDWTADNSGGRN
jgi:hypothetical protein